MPRGGCNPDESPMVSARLVLGQTDRPAITVRRLVSGHAYLPRSISTKRGTGALVAWRIRTRKRVNRTNKLGMTYM